MKKILELLNIPMLMEADRFTGFLHGYRSLTPMAVREIKTERKIAIEGAVLSIGMNSGYAVAAGGLAIVPVMGPMFKGFGSWGYADQSEIRGTIRQAANDPGVSGIMLLIDSPGGSVAGTADLGAEIVAADAIKPVMAYCEDCACSAAYWIASCARAVYSNGGLVGSIGVVASIVDSSKYFENAGVKVFPLVSGAMKAPGMDGVPVSAEQVAYLQNIIETMYSDFVAVVARGRGLRGDAIRKMEAKVFVGEAAVENKLVDGVLSFDKAFSLLGKAVKQNGINKRAKALLAIEEMEG